METRSFKALSQRVLQRNRQRNQQETASFLDAKTGKPDSTLQETMPDNLTLADLETELGSDPDWSTIKTDPELLRGYAETIATTRQVRAGIIPDGWTGVFRCARCGPVYLQPGGPKDLLACPWCFNRERGLPIPRPSGAGKAPTMPQKSTVRL